VLSLIGRCADRMEGNRNSPLPVMARRSSPRSTAAAFDELLAELRVTEEWRYVEREVEIRVCRDGG
jgi:hypothetical protein